MRSTPWRPGADFAGAAKQIAKKRAFAPQSNGLLSLFVSVRSAHAQRPGVD